MAKKYYAVRSGRKTGVFLSWAECEEQVKGFSGAEYKSFTNKEDAKAFCVGTMTQTLETSESKKTADIVQFDYMQEANKKDGTLAVAYVDGSYDNNSHAFSYGMIFIYQGKETKFCQKIEDAALAQMHNVAGEIKGSEAAMTYACNQGIKNLVIYHDYEGIAKWCNGAWKANKEGTKAYRSYYKKMSEKIAITFVKVKGHSNDTYNDIADELAKQALGIGECIHNDANPTFIF